jgi:Na+-transporting NADH:ubiquinone oxidoreductase subunit C
MSFSNQYIFGFAGAICLVCSLSVAAASVSLKDKQDTNRRRDTQGSILRALKLPEDGHVATGDEIDVLWEKRVKPIVITADGTPATDANDLTGDGKVDQKDVDAAAAKVKGTPDSPSLLTIFQRIDEGDQVGAYAIPLRGLGLWGPLSGYIALEPDGATIMGTTFFAPKETPGLGLEIENPAFLAKWPGKRVADASGPRPVRVTKPGLCTGEDCVDGISGATITCRGLDKAVADGIRIYEPYLKQVRAGGS